MFILIISFCLIVGSSIIIGILYAGKDFKKISDLQEMKNALMILRAETVYTRTKIPEVVLKISKRTNGSVSAMYENFYNLLHLRPRDGIGSLWGKVLDKTIFDNYDISMFSSIFNIGITNTGTIDMVINYIDEKIDKLNQSAYKNKKLYSSLGILGGLLTFILIL